MRLKLVINLKKIHYFVNIYHHHQLVCIKKSFYFAKNNFFFAVPGISTPRLIASSGDTKLYALVQSSNIHLKVWFVSTKFDVNLVIEFLLMRPSIFRAKVTGPDNNFIQISWKEEGCPPKLSENFDLPLSGIFFNFKRKNFSRISISQDVKNTCASF